LGDGNITWCYYVIYLGKGYRRSVGGSYPIRTPEGSFIRK
jgi:hypothetical protein